MSNESRPPPDPTIVMQVNVGVRPAQVEKPRTTKRLQYLVQPFEGQWEVVDGANGYRVLYENQQDALVAARAAARAHWAADGKPTGVTLVSDGAPPFVALYGAELPPE